VNYVNSLNLEFAINKRRRADFRKTFKQA